MMRTNFIKIIGQVVQKQVHLWIRTDGLVEMSSFVGFPLRGTQHSLEW